MSKIKIVFKEEDLKGISNDRLLYLYEGIFGEPANTMGVSSSLLNKQLVDSLVENKVITSDIPKDAII